MKKLLHWLLQPKTLVLLFTVGTIAIAIPLFQFMANRNEIGLLYTDVLYLCGALFVALFALLRMLQRWRWFSPVLVWLALSMWLQPQLFPWRGTALDGGLIETAEFYQRAIWEGLLWLGLFCAVITCWRRFGDRGLANLAILIGLVAMGSAVLSQGDGKKWSRAQALTFRYATDTSALQQLSRGKNLYIIILDEAQNNLIWQLLSENPTLREAYQDFTFFTDVAGGFSYTPASFPLIFAGEHYANDRGYERFVLQAYKSEHSIYRHFRELGYKILVFPGWPGTFFPAQGLHDNPGGDTLAPLLEGSATLADLVSFASFPGPIRQLVYNRGRWLFASLGASSRVAGLEIYGLPSGTGDMDTRQIARFLREADVTATDDRLFSVHLRGAHAPWHLDRVGNPVGAQGTTAAYLDQAHYKMRLLAAFLKKLETLGVYDNSAVVIMGDHGTGRTEAQTRLAGAQKEPMSGVSVQAELTVKARANPVFMVKPFGAKQPALTIDRTAVGYGQFHRNLLALTQLGAWHSGKAPRARRYTDHSWRRGEKGAFYDYREYIVAGDIAKDHSWWPLHVHDIVFSDWKTCPFGESGTALTYSREGLKFSKDGEISLSAVTDDFLLVKVAFDPPLEKGESVDIEYWQEGGFRGEQQVTRVDTQFTSAMLVQLAGVNSSRPSEPSTTTTLKLESVSRSLTIQDALLLKKVSE